MSEVKLRLAIRDLYRGDGGPLNEWDQGWNDGVDAAAEIFNAENAALRAEVDALRVDAERYRWLRDDGRGTSVCTSALWGKHPYTDTERANGIDAIIDAARKESA